MYKPPVSHWLWHGAEAEPWHMVWSPRATGRTRTPGGFTGTGGKRLCPQFPLTHRWSSLVTGCSTSKSPIRKEQDYPFPTSKYMARFKQDKQLTEAEKTVIQSICKNEFSNNSEVHEKWFWKNSIFSPGSSALAGRSGSSEHSAALQ